MSEYNLLVSWNEIQEQIILPLNTSLVKIESKDKIKKTKLNSIIIDKLKFKIYKSFNYKTTINTIKYIFFHIRNAIYINIQDNELIQFIPFANKNYKNNWSDNIKFDYVNNLKDYIKIKHSKQRYINNKAYWWLNASIVNNEQRPDVWGNHSLKEYKEIIEETLKLYKVGNLQLIINKRDHPLLNKDLLEPYKHVFQPNTELPSKFLNKKYTPILSPYTNNEYADIPFIIPEDWMLANNNIIEDNNQIEWKDKKEIAFFRGSATGSPRLEENQRLQISKLDVEWRDNNLIDAGVVSWNRRDKIDNNLTMTFIDIANLGFKLKERIPMNEQKIYKYILNINGHSATNRFSYLLQSGSLILNVESLDNVVGTTRWFDHLLKAYIHYIPIKKDFSDLKEQIKWCRDHDKECKKIVKNAQLFYNEYLSRDSILKYSSEVLNHIANKFK